MAKVFMLVQTYHPEAGGAVFEGQEVDVSSALAENWIRRGLASVEPGKPAEGESGSPANFFCPVKGCDHPAFRGEAAVKGHVTREHPQADYSELVSRENAKPLEGES